MVLEGDPPKQRKNKGLGFRKAAHLRLTPLSWEPPPSHNGVAADVVRHMCVDAQDVCVRAFAVVCAPVC